MNEQKTPKDIALENVEPALHLLQAGQSFYNEAPAANEVNLVNEIRIRFQNFGVSEEVLNRCFDNSCFVQEAQGKHAHAQQWNLTRWINEQFNLIQSHDGIDTRLYRYQAIYEIDTDAWLKIFDHGILQNLLEFGLRERK